MIKNLTKNKILFWLGFAHIFIFLCLLIYYPFNDIVVSGINSVIKPMKFAASIWIYSWTMALLLNYVEDSGKVAQYSRVALICMCFEQLVITFQAMRGALSHFNNADSFGIALFALMGVFILVITLWTAYITYIFIKQKKYDVDPPVALGIKFGLVYFVVFSLFGGYLSSLKGHTVGSTDGGKGLFLLNWSTAFGDLRVAHFFGIHSLQIIPLFAIIAVKYLSSYKSILAIKIFAFAYLAFVLFTLIQGLCGVPFVR